MSNDPAGADKDQSNVKKSGAGLAVGIVLGTAIGTAMGNLAAGIAIGIALGVAMGRVSEILCERHTMMLPRSMYATQEEDAGGHAGH